MAEHFKELRGALGFGLESQSSLNLHLLAVDAGICYLSFLQQGWSDSVLVTMPYWQGSGTKVVKSYLRAIRGISRLDLRLLHVARR